MKTLLEYYNEKTNTPSDINEHLPVLKRYSEECDDIIEFGVRGVVSTYAFMMGKPSRLKSNDIFPTEKFGVSIEDLKELALINGVEFNFIIGNTLEIQIPETDLLFIDTWHKYGQLIEELTLHSDNVKKYIILHDTTSYEFTDEGDWGTYGDIKPLSKHKTGLWPAVTDFLETNNKWKIKERLTNNNGLTILERI